MTEAVTEPVRYGRYVVLGEERRRDGVYHFCRCDCGVEKTVRRDHLMSGRTRSCGCLLKEWVIATKTTHGFTKTHRRATSAWQTLIARCTNPENPSFHRYGERGITVCDRWLPDNNGRVNFVADMGEPGKGESLDRIDNDRGYSPENCRWTTIKVQARNTRRNVRLTHNGETLTMVEWAERIGITPRTLRARLFEYDWSVERALTEPVHTHCRTSLAKPRAAYRESLAGVPT